MQIIPTQATPSQGFNVTLANQNFTLNIYQEAFGLFMDVILAGTPVLTSVLCQNLNRIVRDLYLGIIGDFVFFDQQGTSDPNYTGLGSRWQLIYLEQSDLAPGQG